MYVNKNETRGGIVISSGRTEGLVLYQELIYDLVRNGYSVYIHDHRGQGFSGRLDQNDIQLGHIDDFDNYVKDLKLFVDNTIPKPEVRGNKPLFLLAHSMGGAVASLYLENTDNKDKFQAAALVTPMHQPWTDTGEVNKKKLLAKGWCNASIDLPFELPWLSKKYADEADWKPTFDNLIKYNFMPYEENNIAMFANDTTHSISRYKHNWQTRKDAKCGEDYCGNNDAKVGGVSYRWLSQACHKSGHAIENAQKISIPVLLLQGFEDTVVRPSAQEEFCKNTNKSKDSGYCVLKVIGAKHAVFIEADEYRKPALAKILSFFDNCTVGTKDKKECK